MRRMLITIVLCLPILGAAVPRSHVLEGRVSGAGSGAGIMVVARDTAAHAPGALDMKGGIVVMLLALQALEDAELLDRFAIEVFLCGDEEKPGRPPAVPIE